MTNDARTTPGNHEKEAESIRYAIEQHPHALRSLGSKLRVWEEERAFIEHWLELGPVLGRRTWCREDLHER